MPWPGTEELFQQPFTPTTLAAIHPIPLNASARPLCARTLTLKNLFKNLFYCLDSTFFIDFSQYFCI